MQSYPLEVTLIHYLFVLSTVKLDVQELLPVLRFTEKFADTFPIFW